MGKYVLYMDDDYRQVIIIDKYCNGKSIDVSDLTPYTEPDLEQVRKEAYQKGYSEGCDAKFRRLTGSEYQHGLSDAWEAARKITAEYDEGGLSVSDLYKVFGTESAQTILRDNTVQEAIEKIRHLMKRSEERMPLSLQNEGEV